MNRSSSRQESDFLGTGSIPARRRASATSFFRNDGPARRACRSSANGELLAGRVAKSVALEIALNPLNERKKSTLVAKTALANRATIADTAHSLGVMIASDGQALVVRKGLTRSIEREE